MKTKSMPTSSAIKLPPMWLVHEREETLPAASPASESRKGENAPKLAYFALEELQQEDGSTREAIVPHAYHITPEYVSSFAPGADYKSDPVGAVANAKPRSNLGDITNLQKALGLDYETARNLYREFRAVAEKVAAEKAAQKQAPAAAPVASGKEGE